MAISGNIKTMALAELLQWLASGQKTGTLVIDNDEIEKKIFFEGGVIIGSASTDPKEYLGHFLAGYGYITKDQADEAVRRQQDENKLIGQILVDMGVMQEEDLQQMLQLKAEESVYDLFTWEAGDFEFFDSDLPANLRIRMRLDVQWIVLEGSRRLDEWQKVKQYVPSPKAVPVTVVDITTIPELEEFEERLLSWIDDDRTVEEISEGAQVALFQVAQTFAEHVAKGYIKMVRPRVIEVKSGGKGKAVEAVEAATAAPQPQPMQFDMQQMMQMMSAVQGMQGMQQGMGGGQMGFNPPSGAIPTVGGGGQSGGQVDMPGGRTMNFAGGGGGGGAPESNEAMSEADRMLREGDQKLQRGMIIEALASFRKAKDAQGSGPATDDEVKMGEEKVIKALERLGVKLSSVPKLKCGLDELTKLDISPQEGFMLTRVDGSYDVKSILKMSPMPKVDALVLFWRLNRSGQVGF